MYRAEHITFGRPKDFETINDVQKYVNRVTRSKFWKQAGGRPFVLVKQVPNNQNARGWRERIHVPQWGFGKPVVLHELAHSLAYTLDMSEPHHGGLFVLLFRRLIEQELGIDERRRFDRVAELGGVSWSPRKFAIRSRIGG